MPEPTVAPKNKNWLLVKFRQWHSWGGLFLSVFILVVAVTGILLNHKDLFFHGGEKKLPTGLLTSTTDLAALPVSFAAAMDLARGHFGDVSLEKIELKEERGQLHYKVVRGEGEEVRIDAQTGAMTSKYGLALGQSAGKTAGAFNWPKFVDDLHTGKLFGTPGKLTVDLTSLVIIVLTLSGIYLWGVPMLRKRESARRRGEAPAPSPRVRPDMSKFRSRPAVAEPEPEPVEVS